MMMRRPKGSKGCEFDDGIKKNGFVCSKMVTNIILPMISIQLTKRLKFRGVETINDISMN